MYKAEARERQRQAGKEHGAGKKLMVNLPEAINDKSKGTSRDASGKAFRVSGSQVDRACVVLRDGDETQRGMVGARLKPFHEAAAKERKGARTDLVENSTPGPFGKARDTAGAAVNVSGWTVSRAQNVRI